MHGPALNGSRQALVLKAKKKISAGGESEKLGKPKAGKKRINQAGGVAHAKAQKNRHSQIWTVGTRK